MRSYRDACRSTGSGGTIKRLRVDYLYSKVGNTLLFTNLLDNRTSLLNTFFPVTGKVRLPVCEFITQNYNQAITQSGRKATLPHSSFISNMRAVTIDVPRTTASREVRQVLKRVKVDNCQDELKSLSEAMSIFE